MTLTPQAIIPGTLLLVDSVYKHTNYEDAQDSEATFSKLKTDLPSTVLCPDGKKLVQKFSALSSTISTEGTYLDMVKIVWRMVKPMSGDPLHKLGLFFVALGTMNEVLKTMPIGNQSVAWRQRMEVWLGKQLTIGGKGVTGEGEGSVTERTRRFFSTPYLHDFDWFGCTWEENSRSTVNILHELC